MVPIDCHQAMAHPLMQRVVQVESSGNRFAIGVVGGQLVRQPMELNEAVATVLALQSAGRNFSIGLAQVNRVHFAQLGWTHDLSRGFDACANVAAGAAILNDCFARATASGYVHTEDKGAYTARHAALSCYYSGDLTAGARLGYVAKVLGTTASVPDRAASRRPPSMMLSFIE